MEVRRLLSTVVVDTLADETLANSTTSLREAIQLAAAGDTVAFKSGLAGTVTLGGQQLLIDKNLTISGPGANVLGISANNASRVFEVQHGTTVTMSGLTIKHGRDAFGGGINSYGVLTLNNVVVSDNTAAGANGTEEFPNGHEGWGGGIFNFGTLKLNNSAARARTARPSASAARASAVGS
jgi:CSLREA domain-containing protein